MIWRTQISKLGFVGIQGTWFLPFICSQSIKDGNMQLQKIFVLWIYDTRRHANAGSELHCWYTPVFDSVLDLSQI